MKELEKELVQLRDQTWQIARESLDHKETRVYRTLTDVAEKLTELIGATSKMPVAVKSEADMLRIFAQYKGEKYEALLDVSRINGGRRPCIWMEGQWWTASKSAGHITNTSLNGWRHFWRYDKDGVITPIEVLKKQA